MLIVLNSTLRLMGEFYVAQRLAPDEIGGLRVWRLSCMWDKVIEEIEVKKRKKRWNGLMSQYFTARIGEQGTLWGDPQATTKRA